MSTALSIPIDDLRKNIREENTKARSAARKSLDHVRACGEMLMELKSRAGHGNFRYELKQLGIEQRTANNYMRIASNWKHVSTLNHGVRDALKLLTSAEETPTSPPTPPPAPRPSPAPVTIEAEIVEPEAPAITSEPETEPEPLVVDEVTPARRPVMRVIESEGMNIWRLAKMDLDRINKNDEFREKALTACIEYCQGRIKNNK